MTDLHYFLELIRQLERADYFDKADLTHALKVAKSSSHKGFGKLVLRAQTLDDDGTIWQSLKEAQAKALWFERLILMTYAVMGFLGGVALLAGAWLNFFYVFIVLIGWHSIALILWCIRPNTLMASLLHMAISQFWQRQATKDSLQANAYRVLWQSTKPSLNWQISALIHKTWLCGLLGHFLALTGLFLVKNYAFFWQSTLLSEHILTQFIKLIAFVPSLLGFEWTTMPRQLALLLLMSLVLYAVLPRALAYGYTVLRLRAYRFEIDKDLYYYEHLLYQFNQRTIDPDDYQAPIAKPIASFPKTNKTIIATLEYPTQALWYRGAMTDNVHDMGVIDTKDDIDRLSQTIHLKQARLLLAIDSALLPDRGVIRKLQRIADVAQFGIVVQILGDHDHKPLWQQFLNDHHISEWTYD